MCRLSPVCVKPGDICRIGGKIKTDQHLALELWKNRYLEARLLSLLIIKPKELAAKVLNEMVHSVTPVQVADWFNAYVLKEHPEKELI